VNNKTKKNDNPPSLRISIKRAEEMHNDGGKEL
jgi:hypothetical protein